MISRRMFLGGAAAVAAAVPVGIAVTSWTGDAKAAAPTGLALSAVNRTGVHADSDLTMYIVGTDPAGSQAFVRADGSLQAVTAALNGPNGFADLSIPFGTRITLPKMSGRIYFAAGAKLPFRVVNGSALQFPAGWVAGDPSFGVLHDWIEFTFNDAGMFCNTTMVDMFSMPMAIQLTGKAGQTTGTLGPGGRAAIFKALSADPVFGKLVVDNGQRVMAPGHGLEAGVFPADFFDAFVDQVWTKYASTDLVVKTDTNTFTGRVSGDVLRFDNGVAPIKRPSTRDVLFCDGALAAPNDGVTGPVAAIVAAGLNRGTLLADANQPATDPKSFYANAKPHLYAKVMHDNSVDGHAYGFAFDDVANFAAFIQDPAPTAMTVTLTPF